VIKQAKKFQRSSSPVKIKAEEEENAVAKPEIKDKENTQEELPEEGNENDKPEEESEDE
jgi:hypothetical protein